MNGDKTQSTDPVRSLAAGIARLARLYTLHAPWPFAKRSMIAGGRLFGWIDKTRYETVVPTLVGTRSRVRFPDMIQKAIFFCGVWEPAITAFFQRSLSAGDTVIDIGANIGYYSCLASRLVQADGHVHAIEASPTICRLLEANRVLNACDNVTVHNVAIMDRDTTVRVYLGNESSLGTSTVVEEKAPQHARTPEAEVPAMALDSLIDRQTLFASRLIKIDVEGAEWAVFRGIAPLLHLFSDRTEWIIEVTPASVIQDGGSAATIIETFAAAGFRPYRLENRYNIDWYVRHARRILRQDLDQLVQPFDGDIESHTQIDLLLSRRNYPAGGPGTGD